MHSLNSNLRFDPFPAVRKHPNMTSETRNLLSLSRDSRHRQPMPKRKPPAWYPWRAEANNSAV